MDTSVQVDTSDCIEWDRSRNSKNYGQRRIRGKLRLVHRLAWEEEFGPIPDGICVLHKCDNPPCFNVEHLFLGTVAENQKDMANKGRGANQNSRKVTCKNGHPLASDNLLAGFLARGERVCRICRNRWQQANREVGRLTR